MLSPEHFIDTNVIIFSKLALAMLLGAFIGTERAIFARQAAGTRTFGLVALGACLFIVMANYVSLSFIGVVGFDPMRTAAAVITGIGFLGAGLIIFRGDTLHGITTAAGLWIVAGIGILLQKRTVSRKHLILRSWSIHLSARERHRRCARGSPRALCVK